MTPEFHAAIIVAAIAVVLIVGGFLSRNVETPHGCPTCGDDDCPGCGPI